VPEYGHHLSAKAAPDVGDAPLVYAIGDIHGSLGKLEQLMLRWRVLRCANSHQLYFIKFMYSQQATRILPCRTGLTPEARRIPSQAHRQLGAIQDLITKQVRDRHLGRVGGRRPGGHRRRRRGALRRPARPAGWRDRGDAGPEADAPLRGGGDRRLRGRRRLRGWSSQTSPAANAPRGIGPTIAPSGGTVCSAQKLTQPRTIVLDTRVP